MSALVYSRRRVKSIALCLMATSFVLCAVGVDAHIIRTVAGTSDISGRPARSISVDPQGIAMAPDGGVYVADRGHSQVLRFDPTTQTFSVIAGTTVQSYAGDGGPAINAQINYPTAVAVNASGDLLIADQGQGVIRKVSAATGTISTIAGGGWSSDDGVPATQANLQGPTTVAIGPDGSIYVVEQFANRVRRVTADTGLIYTVAGTGAMGYAGDSGPATAAQLSNPIGVAFDALGNLYIADQFNHRVRVVEAATGIIRTFAGTGDSYVVADGAPANETVITSPTSLQFDAQGNLFVTEHDTGRIRKIEAGTTIVSTIAGGGGQPEGVPATSGSIGMPIGLAMASNGDIYVTNEQTYLLQRIVAATGMLEVLAGNNFSHYSGDGSPALAAQMLPSMTVSNTSGDLFFIDGMRIRKVSNSTGMISTIAGNGSWGIVGDDGPAIDSFLAWPTALAIDGSGNLFLSDQGMHRIRRIDAATGVITHFGGTGYGYSGDGGPAVNAQMRQIRDMATDTTGNLYVIVEGGAYIRKIDAATGIITTIAGNGNTSGPWGDGLVATNVALYPLDAIAVDAQRNILFSQQGRIRRIDANTGILSTIAGSGSYGENGDGGPALSAAIIVADLKLDAAGNIFITSLFGNRVRRIDASTGIITTIAGTGVAGLSGDDGDATQANVYLPRDLSFDAGGNLYINEQYRIRKVIGIGAVQSQSDTTPPLIAYNISGTQGNAQGWYITDAVVNWIVNDPESSVTSSSGCASTTINTDSSGTTLTCTATSSGGTASKSVTIKRDAAGPQVSFGTPSPAPNAAGWNNTDVTIPYTVTDTLSGVSGNPQRSLTANAEGANLQWNVGVSDIAGNFMQWTSPGVNIDKTAPTIAPTVPAPGASYTLGSTVLAAYSCGDAISGVASCVGTVPSGSAIDTATAGTKSFSITAVDRAGNSTTTNYTYTVGSAAPSYCSSRGNTSTYEFIRSVKVGATTVTSNNNGGYADLTANPIAVARGANSIVLTPGFGFGSYVEYWRIWIDLNRDGTFSSNELLYTGSSSNALSSNITIPATALSGTTRMRVAMKYGGAASACETFSYGEVEDYRVTIP